jgi:single-strand DNA-binding protein
MAARDRLEAGGSGVSNLNKVQIIGRLGRDPEVRAMPSGGNVANLAIATTEKWKDKNGQKQEKTEWHRVSLFGRMADVAGEYLAKGSLCYIEGRLQTRKYQKDGVDHYATEVIATELKLLSPRPQQGAPRQEQKKPEPQGKADDFDDDIPF